jgi:hypothetical protein
MNLPKFGSGALRRYFALLSMLAMPFAEATEITSPAMSGAVQQLRHVVGLWDVTTTQYDDKGAVARVASGTYRFDWVVPDRVLSGRSDIPEWRQSAGMLFYVNPTRSTIEMTSVGEDGQLWVMSGPAGGETRTTPPTPLADGRKLQLRFTRFNVSQDCFEARMETSYDGGASWKPGNHQKFRRAALARSDSGARLRYRKPQQPYVPLT